jgi:hypothetical protein
VTAGIRVPARLYASRRCGFQQQIASGLLLGPRLHVGKRQVLARRRPGLMASQSLTDLGPPKSRELVRSCMRGADFIKTDDSLSRDVFFAMADEAKRRGFYRRACPGCSQRQRSAEAGMRSIEHARVIAFDCAPGRRRDRQHAMQNTVPISVRTSSHGW